MSNVNKKPIKPQRPARPDERQRKTVAAPERPRKPQRSLKDPNGKPNRDRPVTRPSARGEVPKKVRKPETARTTKISKPPALVPTAIMDTAPTADMLSDAVNQLRAVANGIYTVELPDRFRRQLRPSGLPYCPILDATKNEPATFRQSFYLDIGTAFHEIVQTFVCRSGVARSMVYANFKCTRCNTVELFKPIPRSCFTCGAADYYFKYEELEFEGFRGLGGGHIDLFVKTTRGWLVCDWKTTSENAQRWREDADGKHHHQLQAYCLALAELFGDKLQGLPIIGYCLMFAPREQPGKFTKPKISVKLSEKSPLGSDIITNWSFYPYPFWGEVAEATRKRLRRSKRQFDALSDAYRDKTPRAWFEVARMRPCRSIADFNKPMGMVDGFYKAKLCPNIDICMGTTKSVARFLEHNHVARD
jgi:hypothetical protein